MAQLEALGRPGVAVLPIDGAPVHHPTPEERERTVKRIMAVEARRQHVP